MVQAYKRHTYAHHSKPGDAPIEVVDVQLSTEEIARQDRQTRLAAFDAKTATAAEVAQAVEDLAVELGMKPN